MSGTMPLYLDLITVDFTIQPRAKPIDHTHVARIVAWLEEDAGNETDPVDVYGLPDGTKLLVHGFHRLEAYRIACRLSIPCVLHEGTRAEAVLFAMAANRAQNSLPRTNEDKERAVREVVKIAADWSIRQIAEHVGVSRTLVARIKNEQTPVQPSVVLKPPTQEQTSVVLKPPTDVRETLDEAEPARPTPTWLKNWQEDDEAHDEVHDQAHDPVEEDRAKAKYVGEEQVEYQYTPDDFPNDDSVGSPSSPEIRDDVPAIEEHPADQFAHSLAVICRNLDSIKAEVKSAVTADPFGKLLHLESITHQIDAARKALWQSRPTEACNCVLKDRTPRPECRSCFGTGRTAPALVLRGGR